MRCWPHFGLWCWWRVNEGVRPEEGESCASFARCAADVGVFWEEFGAKFSVEVFVYEFGVSRDGVEASAAYDLYRVFVFVAHDEYVCKWVVNGKHALV